MPVLRWPSSLALYCLIAPHAFCQSGSIQIHGNDEPGISVPVLTVQQGQDPSAVAQLAAYRAAVGAPWTDLRGEGTITYQSAGRNEQGTATIELKGSAESRLDTTDNGVSASLRIHGISGYLQMAGRAPQPLDPMDAAAGHFSFILLQPSGIPAVSGALKDQGEVTVDGKPLRLIAYQEPLPQEGTGSAGNPGSWIVNFYFDPATNLLVKSATISHGLDVPPRPAVQVMTYGNYQKVNGSWIPFTYSESSDGQHIWTIHLTTASTSVGLSDSDFTF